MSELKNVVIVGASSGAALARQLEKKLPASHRIVLIDSNESAYWAIGGLRAAVKPGSEEQMFAPLKGFFKEGSRHVVLPLTKVTAISNSSVTLAEARDGFGTEIPLDLGVIATGSTYPSPMRSEDAVTAEAKAALKKKQEQVAQAEHILIVGGGPVGIEFAGEVKDVHPDKKVTLCTSGKTLLSPDWKPAFPSKLHNQLIKRGVTVQYEAKIDLPDSVKSAELLSEPVEISTPAGPVKTDFVLIASGGAPNTQLLPAAALDDGKRVKVNAASLRVEHAELNKWFALGDANNAPGTKTFMAASAQAPALAANIVSALSNSDAVKAYKPPGAIMVVPIGASGGASQLSVVVLGEWVTALVKGKGLLLSMFKGTYQI